MPVRLPENRVANAQEATPREMLGAPAPNIYRLAVFPSQVRFRWISRNFLSLVRR
jgi:hypothetical protein